MDASRIRSKSPPLLVGAIVLLDPCTLLASYASHPARCFASLVHIPQDFVFSDLEPRGIQVLLIRLHLDLCGMLDSFFIRPKEEAMGGSSLDMISCVDLSGFV